MKNNIKGKIFSASEADTVVTKILNAAQDTFCDVKRQYQPFPKVTMIKVDILIKVGENGKKA